MPEDPTYKQCLFESIKCHHNDFALYIKDNLLKETNSQNDQTPQNNQNNGINGFIQISKNQKKDKLKYLENEIFYGFQSYNFAFISEDLIDPIYFFYSVDFGYYKLVDLLKNKTGLDVNQYIISIVYYFNLILKKKIN